MILSGGAFQNGAALLSDRLQPRAGMVGTRRTHQITSPHPGVDSMSARLRLVPCPLGLPRYVLRARIAHRDAVDLGGDRSGKGTEFNAYATDFLLPWGPPRRHLWRPLIPPNFRFIDGAETNTIIAQVHEMGTNSPPGQPPNFYVQINGRNLNFRQSNPTYQNTRTVYSMPIVAGQEPVFSLYCDWRDGLPAHDTGRSTGRLELNVDGTVVWEDTQAVNCWPDEGDTRQPFPVMGVYKPNNPAEPSWVGAEVEMYHVGAATGDGDETHASLAAFVAAQL